jgi:hypothetical protein
LAFAFYRERQTITRAGKNDSARGLHQTSIGNDCIVQKRSRRYQIMRIYDDDRFVVIYEIPSTKGNLVQDKQFYAALKKDREMNRRKYAHTKPGKGRAKRTISPSKPQYDIDVAIRPVDVYDHFVRQVQI